MAFRSNDSQQLSLMDSYTGLTAREQKVLEKSWAKVFSDEVFPMIDEERFRVLYSEKASRPNTPVNVIVGALIIKELFDLSDDELVENLMLDPRYQYALHTTSFEEQPLSDKSLSRFRKRCYNYETLHGVDLLHDCVKDLSDKIAKMMNLNGRIRRMDSMMIEANIRRLSRLELLYTCIAKLAVYISKADESLLPEGLQHYCMPDDYNRVIYHTRDKDAAEKFSTMLKDADELVLLCGSSYDDVAEYQLLIRCLSEQTIIDNGIRRMRTKEDGGMDSTIMQNPSDPEATFRSKAGKSHRGYAANFEETVGDNRSVITDYAFEQNNYSDSQFMKDHLEGMDVQEEPITVIADGAYGGEENIALAKQKNVNLVTTALLGREVPDAYADFEFNEEGTKIIRCPAGYEPISSNYMSQTGQCRASFDRNLCATCPHRDSCKVDLRKRVGVVLLSRKASNRAKQQQNMQTQEFKALAKIRNGVETIPSILRNRYHVDQMPVRGKLRGKFFLGCKVAALNFRKLFCYQKGLGNYAHNPILA